MSDGSISGRTDGRVPGSYKRGPGGSGSQKPPYEERCVDPVDDMPAESRTVCKDYLKDANRKECESAGFIPSSADTPSAAQTRSPFCSAKSCRTFMCSVLTCGLYRICLQAPCLAPNPTATEEPEQLKLQTVPLRDGKEEDGADWLEDVCIAGVKVNSPREYLDVETKCPSYLSPPLSTTQPSRMSLQDSLRFDDWEDGEEDVDSLISKKLLELYSEYQIEELARCTSDSIFLRKSEAINQLINSLAEEHKMDEQEAECRLVRGIIRISTRKSTKRRPPPATRTERTLSDSGNETMKESASLSFSNNNDYKSNPNIQISELTTSDKCAREMWRNNGGHTSSSSNAFSDSHPTASSGVPLIHTSVRT